MTTTTYNGWTNYETWAVGLWLDNEQSTYNHCRFLAQQCWDDTTTDERHYLTHDERALYDLSEALKDYVEDDNPLIEESSLYSNLLNAALSDVNWREIAEHYLADVDKTTETPTNA